jgi:hypothetical protein
MDPRQLAEPTSAQSNYRTGHRRRSPALGPCADSSNNINPHKIAESRFPRRNRLARTQPLSPRKHRSPQGDLNTT